MDEYTIHCTEEQTRKALELGAPIKRQSAMSNAPIVSYGETLNEYRKKVPKLYNCPTAEQMIGYILDTGKGNSVELGFLIQTNGYKQGCLTFIDYYLK